MTAVLSGTNGLLQAYDYQVLTTAFAYTFAAGTQVLVMNPAGTLATGTITMPASPADGMTITFSSSQQITALTLNGNTGQTVVGAVTFLPAKTGVSYVYRLANTTWYPTVTVPGTGSQLVSGTSQASTSGTSIDFTSIPSWVKRITVMFSGVSTSGTSVKLIQIGTSGGIDATSYLSTSTRLTGGGVNTVGSTVGYNINSVIAADLLQGAISICTLGSNKWVASGLVAENATTLTVTTAGNKTLSATLDRVRITTVNGTDTFTAGSINILYE
jgi:hypothetical protein